MGLAEQSLCDLYRKCNDIIEAGGPQEEIDSLMMEMEGYRMQLAATGSLPIISDRSVNGVRKLRGWLGCHAQTMGHSQNAPSVVNTALATASSNATVTITSVIRQIDKSDLDKRQKEDLKDCIDDIEASKASNPVKLAEKIEKALSIAKNSAEAAKAVIGMVQTLGPFLGA